MSGFEHHTSPAQPEKLPSITTLSSVDPTSSHSTMMSGSSSGSGGSSNNNNNNTTSNTSGPFYNHHYPLTASSTALLSTSSSSSCFLQPAHMANTGLGLLSHPLDNQTPPLTPTVTPSSYLMDLMEMKRKCSVDVGPFGFSSTVQSQQHQQQSMDETYRRASASHTLDNQNGVYHESRTADYTHHNHHHQIHDIYPAGAGSAPVNYHHASHMYLNDNSANSSNTSSVGSRRGSTRASPLQQSNKDHKHVCKYTFCGWSFKRYEHLKRHMLVHSGERPYLCQFPSCGKSFSRSDNFRAHCRTHAKKAYNVNKQQQPNHQHQEASLYNNNNQHHVVIQQQQQPPNPIFPAGPYMNQHDSYITHGSPTDNMGYDPYYHSHHHNIQQHQSQYPAIPLPTVPMTTTTDASTHPTAVAAATTMAPPQPPNASMMERRGSSPHGSPSSNEDDKTHVCPIPECKRPFKRLEHLKRHIRIHTLERPFACTHPNCHKAFSRSDNLSQHIKTHERHDTLRRGSSGSGCCGSLDDPMSDVEDDEGLWC